MTNFSNIVTDYDGINQEWKQEVYTIIFRRKFDAKSMPRPRPWLERQVFYETLEEAQDFIFRMNHEAENRKTLNGGAHPKILMQYCVVKQNTRFVATTEGDYLLAQ